MERLFLQRFGRQGSQFIRILRREFGGLDNLPSNAADRIAGLWANIAFNNADAGKRRMIALMVESLRAGTADLRDEVARSIGVNTRNRKQMNRFMRAFPRGMWDVQAADAIKFYDAHAGRLITNVDEVTRSRIVAMVRNGITDGTSYTTLEKELIKQFPGLGGIQTSETHTQSRPFNCRYRDG